MEGNGERSAARPGSCERFTMSVQLGLATVSCVTAVESREKISNVVIGGSSDVRL